MITQSQFGTTIIVICVLGLVIIGFLTNNFNSLIGSALGVLICLFVLAPILDRLPQKRGK